MTTTAEYDLRGPAFLRDPFTTYAAMRRHDPVYGTVADEAPTVWTSGTSWYLSRYDDCLQVLRDSRRFVKDFRRAMSPEQLAGLPPQPELVRLGGENMLSLDGQGHRRLRRLVSGTFSPARILSMAPRIEAITRELIDRVVDQDTMEMRRDFAFPLPITVICELLGLPPEDREKFQRWAPLAPPRDQEEAARAETNLAKLVAYLRDLTEARRKNPKDDLISALVEAEEEGDRLSRDELLSTIILLLTAGFETTVNMFSNGLLALLRHPDQLELLRQRPELGERAVEELLRFDPPIHTATLRWAAEDVELRGVRIQRGDLVFPILAAANRDPQRFEDPDRLDLEREENPHITFGLGNHYCTGAPLARLELRIGFAALLERLPELSLAIPDEQLRYRDLQPFHSLATLPLRWRV